MNSVSSSSGTKGHRRSDAHYHHLRLADILNPTASDDDDKMGSDDCGGAAEAAGERCGRGGFRRWSPRAALSRCFSLVKRSKAWVIGERREDAGREKGGEEGESDGATTRIRCLTIGPDEGEASSSNLVAEKRTGSSEMVDESGQCKKEIYFNLGIGFGLIFLIATSKNELSKMMELCAQMKILLQSVNKDLHRKDILAKCLESNDHLAYSIIDAQEGSCNKQLETNDNPAHSAIDGQETSISNDHLSLHYHKPSDTQPGLEIARICNQFLECDTPMEEECLKGMDQLEAELEAELERLQLRLELEDFLKQPQQQSIEVSVEETAPRGSISTCFGEVVDPVEASTRKCSAVHPHDLERRLHEILEARQQERINQLEAALECAERKVHEKEIEAAWWKDTAQLISQHAPETFQFISQVKVPHFVK